MNNIIFVLYSYLSDFGKVWLVLWGIMNLTPMKKKRVYIIAGIIQMAILLFCGLYQTKNDSNVTIFCSVMVFIAASFLFEGRIFKKLAYSLLAYTLILFLDICIVGLGSVIYKYPEQGNKYYDITTFFYNTFNLFTIGLFIWIKKKSKKFFPVKISKRIYALLFTGAGTGMLFIAALLESLDRNLSNTGRRTLVIITIIIIVTYCAACFMMILITESRDNYRDLSLISQSVIESQQKYYMLVNEKQQEIRSIRHEMKNHLACIRSLYQTGKLQEMEEYMNEMIESSNGTADLFETGNDIVNAILNDVQSRYHKEHITIRLEGGFPAQLYIAPLDLCVVFANIITNAVEAILRMNRKAGEESYIDVKISSFKEDLYIDINNPIEKKAEVINGTLVTSKKDKSLHGFGVANVIKRVEKYRGSYKFRMENKQFYVEIFLKNQAIN